MHRNTGTFGPSYRFIFAMMAALAAIAIIAFFAWRSLAPRPAVIRGPITTIKIPSTVTIGGAFSLTDHTGAPVTDEDFRGQFMLINFGYTFCPDVCPTTLQTISGAMDILGADAARLQPIFITIDPERDTVETLSSYIPAFHPKLIGLTGAKAKTDKIAALFKVYHKKASGDDGADYFMDHSAFIYLMGPDGAFITMFRHDAGPEILARDIRDFLEEPKS